MQSDRGTRQYFNENCPEYSPGRLTYACRWIAEHVDVSTARLLDVGCGTGNILAHVVARTGISDVTGMDASEGPLARVGERLGCPTVHASILDPEVADRFPHRFDVVLLVAVLHHLVGRTRRMSRQYAARAVRAALELTAPDGHLVVVEPVFHPRAAMTVVFYAKQAVSSVTTRRVELFDRWNNIGAPVVSYLTSDELEQLARNSGATIVADDTVERLLHPLMRVGGIRRRADLTYVLAP